MFIAGLFTVPKIWKQIKFLSPVDERIEKGNIYIYHFLYIYTYIYTCTHHVFIYIIFICQSYPSKAVEGGVIEDRKI